MSRPARVAIVGAGISGLAAAHTLAVEGPAALPGLEVLVLERGERLGGRAHAVASDGWLVEAGPSGWVDSDPGIRGLIRASELESRVVRARREAARRWILLDGKPHGVSLNPFATLRSGLLSPSGLLRALAEVAVGRRSVPDAGADESVRDFFARRFGVEVADRIVRTALLGVFAGDADRLSVRACFPALVEHERASGSVVRGLLRGRRRGRPRGGLSSFAGGMSELPRALARHPGVELRLGSGVVGVRRGRAAERSFVLQIERGGHVGADALIVATSAGPAGALLRELAPRAARRLSAIPTPPLLVVALGYRSEQLAALPDGFGVLLARGEGYRMLGVLDESNIFPERAPSGFTLLRTMYGGSMDPEVVHHDDAEMVRLATTELGRAFGARGEPARSWVFRWPRALPQYELGHPRLRAEVEAELAMERGLFLAGDALEGVSFTATAGAGIGRAREALATLSCGAGDGAAPRRSPPSRPAIR